ncbi:hypothetical protein, partial [Streptosporangium sp. NPDC049644]|uniref:hypothetical protein n=1 Tax=Streptosporangium sp. NPDC049644 TaxID=3155507 RepID=UPI003419C487
MAATYRAVGFGSGQTTGSFTGTKPTGTVSGDILIAFQASDTDSTLTDLGTPTGGATWQLLGSRSGGPIQKYWWKVAGGSEPTTYGFTQGSTANGIVIIVAVSGGATTTPIHANNSSGSTTTVTTPTITSPGADALELRFASGIAGGATTWTPPSGHTERREQQVSTNLSGHVTTRALTAGGATGTANHTASVNQTSRGGVTIAVATA